MRNVYISVGVMIVLALAGWAGLAWAGSKVYVGTERPSDSLVPLDQIDHAIWDRLLKKYVDQDGMVHYAAWKASPAGVAALDEYLGSLGRGDLQAKTSRAARLAFWINAYNAVTLRGILREYPTSSIRNHTSRFYGYDIWHDLLLRLSGESYSLDAMEHKVLRKMGEPRVHFAIVCASIGCPRLRDEAYAPEQMEEQLADNTRDFFSRRQHFRVDAPQRAVYVSSILKWFSGDFGPTAKQGLIGLADYLPDDASRRMIRSGDFSVHYLDYNWLLNDRPGAPTTTMRR